MNLSIKIFAAISVLALTVSCTRWTAPVESAEPTAEAYDGPKVTYMADVVPIMERSCTPCHFPAEGGKKRSLDNYDGVKKEINPIIKYVQLDPSSRKYMPYKSKKPALTAEEVEMLKNWARGGFIKE